MIENTNELGMVHDQIGSKERLTSVAQKLSDAVNSLDADTEYGTTGRETTGGVIMAALARALVGVERELREAAKEQSASTAKNSAKIIAMAPSVPSKAS